MTKCLILPLALFAVSACTVEASGPKDTVDPSIRDQSAFCTTWAKAACNDTVVANCNEVDTATCVEHQSAFCQTLVPSTGYSPSQAQDCIDAVKAAYADAQLDATELDLVLRLGGACSHLVVGPSKQGEPCSQDSDCDTTKNYSCVIKGGDAQGTCQIPVIQANGAPCDGLAMVCGAGAYCDTDSGDNCLTDKKQGAKCTYDAMCGDGLRCNIPTDSTDGSGTCDAKLANKATCTADTDCAAGICRSDTMICTSKVILTGADPICNDL
ncbi:MAG TPA: dickkopf-related protein [Polyangiaceae bacterium]|nr:dickkopf-related protein [Polyangiaceae bacterium]